jgi:hypothetical protein
MEQLKNPFVIYGYKGAEYFCDRKKETETLINALRNERNVVLISPRRVGKTGLIHHVFEQVRKNEPDTRCFYMDINATRNMSQFIQFLAKTVVGQVDTFPQAALRKITSFFSSYRPTVSFDELTGSPTFSITVAPDRQEESLKHIFEYLKQSDKRIYIAIDEFQQIVEYPEKGTEALLRSYIQFLPNVYFIFAGSSQHLMSEMFLSAKRPFYQSSQIMSLPLIDVGEYEVFANRWLKQKGIEISDSDFRYIYDLVDGQTWYVQCILNRLYENGENIDKQTIVRIVEGTINEQEDAFINYCKSLSNNQAALVVAIAKEKGVASALSQEFIRKYSLPAASSVSLALKALRKRDFVYDFNGKIIVYDRFFSIWLRRETE